MTETSELKLNANNYINCRYLQTQHNQCIRTQSVRARKNEKSFTTVRVRNTYNTLHAFRSTTCKQEYCILLLTLSQITPTNFSVTNLHQKHMLKHGHMLLPIHIGKLICSSSSTGNFSFESVTQRWKREQYNTGRVGEEQSFIRGEGWGKAKFDLKCARVRRTLIFSEFVSDFGK